MNVLRGGGFPSAGDRLTGKGGVSYAGNYSPNNGRDPEQPELRNSPASDEYRRPGAPSGIHGPVCDRDPNQVNECLTQADCDRREALRGSVVGCAQDNHQEHECKHDFCCQASDQRVPPGECAPYPFDAKPSVNLNPAFPLAITNRTPAAAMAPRV